MTDGGKSHELRVAEVVSEVSVWGIGKDLGDPVEHDDGSETEMFDIEFPDTHPRVAMEVTSIVDGHFAATANAAQKTVDKGLTKLAEVAGRRVRYTFQVYAGASLKDLADLMTNVIDTGITPDGRDIGPGLIRVDAERSEYPEVVIATWSSHSPGPLQGFGPELLDAIDANRRKLGRAQDFERHLAVDVLGIRASDPALTPAPSLPSEIDFLWVTRRSYSLSRGSPVVWLTDGTGPWRTNGLPSDAM
jgi:hypothetical protein